MAADDIGCFLLPPGPSGAFGGKKGLVAEGQGPMNRFLYCDFS